jgi:hypothetical protein
MLKTEAENLKDDLQPLKPLRWYFRASKI